MSSMCGVQLTDGRRSMDLMFILGLNETIDHWYGHVLVREDGHALRRALDFKVEGQRKIWKPEWMRKKQVEEESVKVGVSREDALYQSKWSVGVNQIANWLR